MAMTGNGDNDTSVQPQPCSAGSRNGGSSRRTLARDYDCLWKPPGSFADCPAWDIEDKYSVTTYRIQIESKQCCRQKSTCRQLRKRGIESMEKCVKRGDVYIADLEPIVGSEQGGTRPVLVIQNDIGNRFSNTTIVAAITARESKKFIPTHKKIACGVLREESQILLEQIRTIDKVRLGKFVGKISEEEMEMVDQVIALSLGLKQTQEVENR